MKVTLIEFGAVEYAINTEADGELSIRRVLDIDKDRKLLRVPDLLSEDLTGGVVHMATALPVSEVGNFPSANNLLDLREVLTHEEPAVGVLPRPLAVGGFGHHGFSVLHRISV